MYKTYKIDRREASCVLPLQYKLLLLLLLSLVFNQFHVLLNVQKVIHKILLKLRNNQNISYINMKMTSLYAAKLCSKSQ